MSKRLYFGHPINTYNTDIEKQLLHKISETFRGWNIENPNQKHHQEGYRHWKERYKNGMEYFYKKVLPQCHAGIFLPFRDGKWSIGVFREAKFLSQQEYPIWQITAVGIIIKINDIFSVPVLSIKETRSRIRTLSGETIPY